MSGYEELIARLRRSHPTSVQAHNGSNILLEAATALEAAQRENEKLRDALGPLVAISLQSSLPAERDAAKAGLAVLSAMNEQTVKQEA